MTKRQVLSSFRAIISTDMQNNEYLCEVKCKIVSKQNQKHEHLQLHHSAWCLGDDAYHLHHHRPVHRNEIRKGAQVGTLRGCRFRGPWWRDGTAHHQLQRPVESHFRSLSSAAQRVRHGLASSGCRGLQHSCRRPHHPHLPGCEFPHAHHQDHTHRQH